MAFELLTAASCPSRLRFSSVPDRSHLRRLLSGIADMGLPVVEITRYAIDKASAPGLRNPRGVVVSELKEPDLHAVYEHSQRQRRVRDGRRAARVHEAERAEREASQSAEAQRAREAQEAAIAAASAEQIDRAIATVLEEADPFLAKRLRRLTTEQLIRRPATRGLIVRALDQSPTAVS